MTPVPIVLMVKATEYRIDAQASEKRKLLRPLPRAKFVRRMRCSADPVLPPQSKMDTLL